VPDWTYVPLHRPAARVLGAARMQSWALRLLSTVVGLPGGKRLVASVTGSVPLSSGVTVDGVAYRSRVGVVVSSATPQRAALFDALGYGFIATADTLPTGAIRHDGSVEELVATIEAGAELLAVRQSIISFGPGLAVRVMETLQSTQPVMSDTKWHLTRMRSWPSWWWAFLVGLGMLATGVFASLITIGPVLLGYDRAFLGTGTGGLNGVNGRLVEFLQHDRITMAGCCLAIGINDIGLALGMRRGWRWAKRAFVAAGIVGFPTFLLALGYGFFDPLHFGSAVVLLGLYLAASFRSLGPRRWTVPARLDVADRRRALTGQLVMVICGFGIFVSGFGIMVIGLTSVLIPSDLAYMHTTSAHLTEANDHLLRFVAHDRAGFGGALTSLAVGITTMVLWGWRDGERWVWWTLLLSSLVGFGPAIAVHHLVGYTNFFHLLPVYLAMVMTTTALALSRRWMLPRQQI
jgi:hypothetical protein